MAAIPVFLSLGLILLATTPSRFDPERAREASRQAREAFGLRSDEAAHAAAAASATAREAVDRYGMPLTPDELAEMDQRTDIALRSGALEGALRAEAPDSFAGIFIDNADGGALVVLATHPAEIDSGKIVDVVGGRPFSVRRVDRSANQLQSDLEDLKRWAGEMRLAGDGAVTGLSIDEKDNTIRVSVADGRDRGRVVGALAARGVPSYVEFVEGVATPETAVRGGDRIGNDTSDCSAGIQAFRNTAYGRFDYTLTAKHCANSLKHKTGGHGCGDHPLRHDAAARANNTIYGPVMYADVQLNYSISSDAYVGPGTSRPVLGESHLYGWGYADTIGMPVCKRGATTGTTCGTLRSKGEYFWVDALNSWLNEQRGADYASDVGDSGGVVYTPVTGGVVVLGGHFGRHLGRAMYSHIWFMHQELDEEGYSFQTKTVGLPSTQ